MSALAARKRSGLPFSGSLGIKKETPQIYKVEPAIAYEETEDDFDPEIFTKSLNLSSGKIHLYINNSGMKESILMFFSDNYRTENSATGTSTNQDRRFDSYSQVFVRKKVSAMSIL